MTCEWSETIRLSKDMNKNKVFKACHVLLHVSYLFCDGQLHCHIEDGVDVVFVTSEVQLEDCTERMFIVLRLFDTRWTKRIAHKSLALG